MRNYLLTSFTRILEKETVGLIIFNFLYSETMVNISDMCAMIKHRLRMGIIKLLLFSKRVCAKCLHHVFLRQIQMIMLSDRKMFRYMTQSQV